MRCFITYIAFLQRWEKSKIGNNSTMYLSIGFVDNLLSIALRSGVRVSLVVGLVFGSPSRIIGKEMKASSNERFLKKLCLY
jgi:hypothetical protein